MEAQSVYSPSLPLMPIEVPYEELVAFCSGKLVEAEESGEPHDATAAAPDAPHPHGPRKLSRHEMSGIL